MEKTSTEIKEYITPASKRAAALSTTLSLIYAMHTIGLVNLAKLNSLPLTGIPIVSDYAAPAILVSMVIAFLTWLTRFYFERRYQGKVAQAATKDARLTTKRNIRTSWADFDLKPIEDNFETNVIKKNLYKNWYIYDDQQDVGFKYSPNPDVIEAEKLAEWIEYKQQREAKIERQKARERALAELKQVEDIERGLSWHSTLTYVGMPLIVFGFALVGLTLRICKIFPLIG